MNTARIEPVTLREHMRQYMPEFPENLIPENAPFMVVPLETIRKYAVYPTPLFKPRYNILLHITKGTVRAQVGLDRIEAKRDSILLMLSGRIIAREYLSRDLQGYCIIFNDDLLLRVLNKQKLPALLQIYPAILPGKETSRTIALLNGLLAAEVKRTAINTDFALSVLQAVLLKLLEHSNLSGAVSRTEETAFRFRQLLYVHASEEHSVRFYAGKLHVTENYLGRSTRLTFGKSPKDLWTALIIQQAKMMFQDKTLEIAEVAYELNFTDPSYFGRLFRQVTGQSPTEYRRHLVHGLSG